MKLRKLDVSEHDRTRALWEEIFTEDTKAFLDYYYFLKTRENEIFVLEEDNQIKSMLHLNPYQVKVNDAIHLLHYIVAVATRAECRKQGFMRTLLCHSMEEMYTRKEPFTFLMPAAEAIYTPYDFRIVYKQNQCNMPVYETGTMVIAQEAGLGDVSELAVFYQQNSASHDKVCIDKNEAYFQNKLFEQQSESGGIQLIKEKGEIVCMYAYGREEHLEVMEPCILPGYEDFFVQSVFELEKKKNCEVLVTGFHKNDGWFSQTNHSIKQVPLIMARIIHLQTFLEQLHTKIEETICISFAVIDLYLQKNSGIWNLRSDPENPGRILVAEAEDSEGVFPIAVLTQFLFGMISIEELENEKDVILNEHLKNELHKIERLEPVFINEVV